MLYIYMNLHFFKKNHRDRAEGLEYFGCKYIVIFFHESNFNIFLKNYNIRRLTTVYMKYKV